MNIVFKVMLGFLLVVFLSSCARTMLIDEEKLQGDVATLHMRTKGFEDYRTIPLIKSKVINVNLYQFDDCKAFEKKPNFLRERMGAATLTPNSHEQTVAIPVNKQVFIELDSSELVIGSSSSCQVGAILSPKKDKEYSILFKTYKRGHCRVSVSEIVGGEEVPTPDVRYAHIEHSFWSGPRMKLCPKET